MLDVPMAGRVDKGFFTTEIEKALLENTVDIAVHSLKDLPVVLPDGLTLGAVLSRADARDVLITKDGRTVEQLTTDDVVATSSLRRRAQLLQINPNLKIIDIRGNVDTRLRKLDEGYCTALVIASAGIDRMGIHPEGCQRLSLDAMIPAAGQAIIGIEARDNDTEVLRILEAINHKPSAVAASAERTYLQIIEGGCHVPSGCHCEPDGEQMKITAFLSHIDGSGSIKQTVFASPSEVDVKAAELAHHILDAGGKEIMAAYAVKK